MKRFVTTFFAALALATLVVFAGHVGHSIALGTPTHSFAALTDSKNDVCGGIGLTGTNCSDNGKGLNTIITAVLQILSVVVGLVAVIMIIIAGLRYITSAGDANGISSAKRTLIYSMVGLVVVALAQTIVHFVLSKVD